LHYESKLIIYTEEELKNQKNEHVFAVHRNNESIDHSALEEVLTYFKQNPEMINEPINNNGDTIFHELVTNRFSNEIEKFIKIKDANLDIKNLDGKTPLSKSCRGGNIEPATILLQYGANPNISENDGYNPRTAIETAPENYAVHKLQGVLKANLSKYGDRPTTENKLSTATGFNSQEQSK